MAERRARDGARAGKADVVDDFMARLVHTRKAEIQFVRKLILGADRRIREDVKWNAPSFLIDEHFATLRLRPNDIVQVVFHTGARAKSGTKSVRIDDPSGILTWANKDRCVATFADMDDVASKKHAFVHIVKQWIAETAD